MIHFVAVDSKPDLMGFKMSTLKQKSAEDKTGFN
jgi:hypothetical protein